MDGNNEGGRFIPLNGGDRMNDEATELIIIGLCGVAWGSAFVLVSVWGLLS